MRHRLPLLSHQREGLIGAPGGAAGVSSDEAGLLEQRPVRVRGVDEPAPLADLAEEPARHPTAEHVVHSRQRVAAFVVACEGGRSDDYVGLLRVAQAHVGDRLEHRDCDAALPGGGLHPAPQTSDLVRDGAGVDVAGDRDHRAAGAVPAPEVRRHVVAGHGGDRLPGAEHRPAERVVVQDRLTEDVVHELVGRVLVHVDLLEHHVALRLDLVGAQRWVLGDVGEDVEAEVEVVVEHTDVEDRLLLGRPR